MPLVAFDAAVTVSVLPSTSVSFATMVAAMTTTAVSSVVVRGVIDGHRRVVDGVTVTVTCPISVSVPSLTV